MTSILEVKLGRYESLNPFLMVSIPKSYRSTAIHKQLRNKSRELMTNFDLHATFIDILEVQMKSNFSDTSYREPQDSGSSLFREWRVHPEQQITLHKGTTCTRLGGVTGKTS
nr:Protein T07G12.3 [Haemonchus contortus]